MSWGAAGAGRDREEGGGSQQAQARLVKRGREVAPAMEGGSPAQTYRGARVGFRRGNSAPFRQPRAQRRRLPAPHPRPAAHLPPVPPLREPPHRRRPVLWDRLCAAPPSVPQALRALHGHAHGCRLEATSLSLFSGSQRPQPHLRCGGVGLLSDPGNCGGGEGLGGAPDAAGSRPVTSRSPAHSLAAPQTSQEHLLWEGHRAEPPRVQAWRRCPLVREGPVSTTTTAAALVQAGGARNTGRQPGSPSTPSTPMV